MLQLKILRATMVLNTATQSEKKRGRKEEKDNNKKPM